LALQEWSELLSQVFKEADPIEFCVNENGLSLSSLTAILTVCAMSIEILLAFEIGMLAVEGAWL
jgi:hypothetical protein